MSEAFPDVAGPAPKPRYMTKQRWLKVATTLGVAAVGALIKGGWDYFTPKKEIAPITFAALTMIGDHNSQTNIGVAPAPRVLTKDGCSTVLGRVPKGRHVEMGAVAQQSEPFQFASQIGGCLKQEGYDVQGIDTVIDTTAAFRRGVDIRDNPSANKTYIMVYEQPGPDSVPVH